MASVTKRIPATPRQAARLPSTLDRQLNTELFKALSDPSRTKLLACLIKCGRPCTVTEVAKCCNVDFSVVARHLGLLARAKVLDVHRQGRTALYRARSRELCERLRALAGAIDEWCNMGGGKGATQGFRPEDPSCCPPNQPGKPRKKSAG